MIRVGLLIDRCHGRTRWSIEIVALVIGTASSASSPGMPCR